MAISEDTAALVAAQLTTAALAGKQGLDPKHFMQMYRDFKAFVSKDADEITKEVTSNG